MVLLFLFFYSYFEVICTKLAKSNQQNTEEKAQTEILFKDGNSQRQSCKFLDMRCNICYKGSLQLAQMFAEKRAGALKVTTAVEDKHLVIESKRCKGKSAPELIAELNSSGQQPVLLSTIKNRLTSVGLGGCIVTKKPLL